MNFIKPSLLASAMMITACSPPEPKPVVFASLYFSDDVRHDFPMLGRASPMTYRELLIEELAKRGINIDEIEFLPERGNPRQLVLRLKNGIIDQAQQERIRAYLTDIVENRKKSSLDASLEVQEERKKGTHTAEKNSRSDVSPLVEIKASEKYNANLFWRVSPLEILANQQGSNNLQCEVVFNLQQALPYAALSITPSETASHEEWLSASVKYKRNFSISSESIPARIKFHDPDLARLIIKGMIQINFSAKFPPLPVDKIGFTVLGSGLGEVEHVNGLVESDVVYHAEQKCYGLAASLGRPFSFHLGHSMDRLSYVTFNSIDKPD